MILQLGDSSALGGSFPHKAGLVSSATSRTWTRGALVLLGLLVLGAVARICVRATERHGTQVPIHAVATPHDSRRRGGRHRRPVTREVVTRVRSRQDGLAP